MACPQAQGSVLPSLLLLTVLLAVLLPPSAECKDPSSPPPHHLNERLSSVEGDLEVTDVGKGGERAEAVGKHRELGRGEEEVALAVEPQRLLSKASNMATRPTLKSWPDLVGLDAEEAKKKILEEHPNMQVQIVPEGSMVTADMNYGRVRIHKNKEQKVAQIPRQG